MCRLRAKHTSVCKAAVVWQNCQLLADIANKICQYYFLNYNAISANGSMTKQPHDKLLLRGRKKKGKWREIERRRQLFNCAWIIRIRRFCLDPAQSHSLCFLLISILSSQKENRRGQESYGTSRTSKKRWKIIFHYKLEIQRFLAPINPFS